jgi:peroxiredoxin
MISIGAWLLVPSFVFGAADRVPGDLTLRTLDGAPVTLGSFRGQVVLLDLWATWCESCRDALPAYDELYKALGARGLAVIAVSIDEHDSDVDTFLARHPLSLTVLRDPKAALADALRLSMLPMSYIVDRDGTIRTRHRGFKEGDTAQLRAEIEPLLHKASAKRALTTASRAAGRKDP